MAPSRPTAPSAVRGTGTPLKSWHKIRAATQGRPYVTIPDPMSTFYLTTPVYYVNALPHIGHIFTTTVGDTLARYLRMSGQDVYFLTGTDEHGQNIERAARDEGIAPIALADRVVAKYRELRDRLEFSYDDFVRTTEERHKRGVYEIVRRIEAAGD